MSTPLAPPDRDDDAFRAAALRAGRTPVPRRFVFLVAAAFIVLGGGGYNPYAVARCWAGTWGVLTDQPIPTSLPKSALDVLAGIRYFRAEGRNPLQRWLTTLAD
jgi:hypothetical protein